MKQMTIKNSKARSRIAIVVLLAMLATTIFSASSVFATEYNDKKNSIDSDNEYGGDAVGFELTPTEAQEALEQQIQKDIAAIISQDTQGGMLRAAPNQSYTYQYGPKVERTAKGYAGSQLSGGYKFPSGGGFYFTDSDGPNVSISVGFSAPYLPVSFSVSMGNKTGSGIWVKAPNKTQYFKIYVEKTYSIQPIVIYRNGVMWQRIHSKVPVRLSAYAKAVS